MKHIVVKYHIIATSFSDANHWRFVVVHCGSHINSPCAFIKKKNLRRYSESQNRLSFRAEPRTFEGSGFYRPC